MVDVRFLHPPGVARGELGVGVLFWVAPKMGDTPQTHWWQRRNHQTSSKNVTLPAPAIYIYLYSDPSCFDLAKSQTGTQKIAASATAAQRMAQRFPSRLDNADEFQVIVQRGASRDLLDLALFICIESHLGKVGVGGGLWPLIGEMMEWMVANHQDVYTDI